MYPDEFSRCHPMVGFVYFALVLGFSMFCMHPLCLLVSLSCALSYTLMLKGRKCLKLLRNIALLCLLAVVLNAAFNHRGATILFYLPSDNPLTLESIAYGLASAAMLLSVMLWCLCFSEVMGTDKLLYLFGSAVPSLSLLLSMILRFIPRYKRQLQAVRDAQEGLGITNGNFYAKSCSAVRCFSSLVAWSLESSVDVADSMRSRGYGVGKRTSYSNYTLEVRDRRILYFLAFAGLLLLSGVIVGGVSYSYFPKLSFDFRSICSPILYLLYLSVSLLPIYLDGKSKRLWNTFESKT